MEQSAIIKQVSGGAIPLHGNDIDTDRIIPARFLRCVVFDGLGEHAFEDDRKGLREAGRVHPFDDTAYGEASLLFVNKNFGCGSSREHAPQALMRWGIKAIVGESFAEIFFGNCVSLGIPCLTASEKDMEQIQAASEANPSAAWKLDLESETLEGPVTMHLSLPPGPKSQFLSGTWNALSELSRDYSEVEAVAQKLPYVSGW